MRIGDWVLTLFVLGMGLVLAGALVTSWWLLVPGGLSLVGSLLLTAADDAGSVPYDDERRWP